MSGVTGTGLVRSFSGMQILLSAHRIVELYRGKKRVRSARRGDCKGGSGVAPGCLKYAAWSQGRRWDIPKFGFQKFSADRLRLLSPSVHLTAGSGETFEGGSGAVLGCLKYAAWSQGWRWDIPEFDFQKISGDRIRVLSPSVHLIAAVREIAGRTHRGRICMPD